MSSEATWEALQLLAEPTRRSLFLACRTAAGPRTREQLAADVGVSRRLAAFHLDLLADAGLLTVDYARPAGRSGPGAGRPAKRYAATAVDLELSVPTRHYDLAARIMARGIATTNDGDAREATFAVAQEEGSRIGRFRQTGRKMSASATMAAAVNVLTDLGYEPCTEPGGCVRLSNCPFDAVVTVATDVVCGINHHFVNGVLDGLNGSRSVRAALDPQPGCCCVALSRTRTTD